MILCFRKKSAALSKNNPHTIPSREAKYFLNCSALIFSGKIMGMKILNRYRKTNRPAVINKNRGIKYPDEIF